jgi:hypothetical protein
VGAEAQPKVPPAVPAVPAVPVVPTHSQTATPTKKVSAEALVAKSPPGSPQVAPAAPPPVAEAPSKPPTFKASTGFYLAMECLFDSVIKSVAYLPKYNLYVDDTCQGPWLSGRSVCVVCVVCVFLFLTLTGTYARLAIGDQNGFLTIVDTRTASRVLGAAVAQQPEVGAISGIAWLCPCPVSHSICVCAMTISLSRA